MKHFRPPIPKTVASKKRPVLLPPNRAIKTFDPSLNDLTKSCSIEKPKSPSIVDTSHSEHWKLKMTLPKKFFLFSSTLNTAAPSKTEKTKVLASTINRLSISRHTQNTKQPHQGITSSPEDKTHPTRMITGLRLYGKVRPKKWDRIDRFLLSFDREEQFPDVVQRRLPRICLIIFHYWSIAGFRVGEVGILSLIICA
jgi:hypothetical protein